MPVLVCNRVSVPVSKCVPVCCAVGSCIYRFGVQVHSSTGVGAFVAHTFSGGQVCHEVDKARGGVLHYVCDPDSAEVQQASSEKSAMEMYTGVVLKVEEPSKCQYRITMHVLALCALPEFGASP